MSCKLMQVPGGGTLFLAAVSFHVCLHGDVMLDIIDLMEVFKDIVHNYHYFSI
nr:hypothetical protein [Candidatus Sigynarchaeota archaeon]